MVSQGDEDEQGRAEDQPRLRHQPYQARQEQTTVESRHVDLVSCAHVRPLLVRGKGLWQNRQDQVASRLPGLEGKSRLLELRLFLPQQVENLLPQISDLLARCRQPHGIQEILPFVPQAQNLPA